MELLNDQQKRDLVGFIAEDFGSGLDRQAFTEVCLQCFEDIAGFETISTKSASRIIDQLWRTYRGQDSQASAAIR